ncbi:hypothetical protein ACL02T_10880 [Pseudonocardia sp. RS010]|uniref:hypothetical protein n=1 Tax=Pseudonocardia sp. RS010 TaxID=3385979 RepID=UPI0039A07DFB
MTTQPITPAPITPGVSAEEASRALERYRLNQHPGEWGYTRQSPSPGHDVLGVASPKPCDRYTARIRGMFRREELPELIAFLTALYAASEPIRPPAGEPAGFPHATAAGTRLTPAGLRPAATD